MKNKIMPKLMNKIQKKSMWKSKCKQRKMQINMSGGLGSNNFLFGDLNLKQRNRKKMCNATIGEKRIKKIYCFLPEMVPRD